MLRLIATNPRDASVGTWNPKKSRIILLPINARTTPMEGCKYSNSDIPSATRMNRDRKPKMAKKFDVITMKGSLVTPKTAGIESTANAISLSSITAMVSSKGVACPKCSRLSSHPPEV